MLTAMPAVSLVLMTIAAIVHIGFFLMESVLWMRPVVHRVFGVASIGDAEAMRFALLNQGFYNLFLAAGTLVGVAIGSDDLVVFGALFMVGAAVVLVAGDQQLWRGALIQGGLPVVALVLAATL
jgi:putative membrane protein